MYRNWTMKRGCTLNSSTYLYLTNDKGYCYFYLIKDKGCISYCITKKVHHRLKKHRSTLTPPHSYIHDSSNVNSRHLLICNLSQSDAKLHANTIQFYCIRFLQCIKTIENLKHKSHEKGQDSVHLLLKNRIDSCPSKSCIRFFVVLQRLRTASYLSHVVCSK